MNRLSTNKFLVIAQHEFITTITRPFYLIVTLGMPVVIFGVLWIELLLVAHVFKQEMTTTAGVIDRSGLIIFESGKDLTKHRSEPARDLEAMTNRMVELDRYDDLDRALDDLAHGRIFACYLIESDYLKTGKITTYLRESRVGTAKNYLGEQHLVRLIRASLLEGRVPAEIRERALYPARFDRLEVSAQSRISPETTGTAKIYSILSPVLLCMLLTSIIFTSSGYLMQSFIFENRNRVMEILLSSVRPIELLAGKMLGLGAAGIISAGIYSTFPTLILTPYFATQGWRLSVLLVLYVSLGYLLYAVLLTATGVIANGMQEHNRLASFWTALIYLPGLVFILSSEMNSWLARAMSWFPLTAPTTMLIRLCYAEVAGWDICLSIIFLVAGIFTALRFATKIFRTSSLMYGKRLTLTELRRWLREA